MNAITDQKRMDFEEGYIKGLLHAYSLIQSNQVRELERLIREARRYE